MTSRPISGPALDSEPPGYRFGLGVQWHPEYALSDGDSAIFTAFVAAASGGAT